MTREATLRSIVLSPTSTIIPPRREGLTLRNIISLTELLFKSIQRSITLLVNFKTLDCLAASDCLREASNFVKMSLVKG